MTTTESKHENRLDRIGIVGASLRFTILTGSVSGKKKVSGVQRHKNQTDRQEGILTTDELRKYDTPME